MNTKKLRVAILFGGRSAEHDVSIRSAQSVYHAIDKEKYDIELVGITQSGAWHLLPKERMHHTPGAIREELLQSTASEEHEGRLFYQATYFDDIDVVFPLLHGPYGEDGTVQGFLRLVNIPFVGADVLGSAIGMDKDVMKRLLREAGIPISNFLVIHAGDAIDPDRIISEIGLPLFVKPANLGSSVGVSKVKTLHDLIPAITLALTFDNKVIIEAFVSGRELEISVLGNEQLETSVIGEIIPTHEFYSYEAKYIDQNGARLCIPAEIPEHISSEIARLAKESFRILECADFARVDFFLRTDGKVFVNEINTIPGFTSISMYPKLWEASGVSYSELIDKIIHLALMRHTARQRLIVTYQS